MDQPLITFIFLGLWRFRSSLDNGFGVGHRTWRFNLGASCALTPVECSWVRETSLTVLVLSATFRADGSTEKTMRTVVLILFGLLPATAEAQSFNCRYARQPDEVTICGDRRLSQLDERLSGRFYRLRNRLGSWIASNARKQCGSVAVQDAGAMPIASRRHTSPGSTGSRNGSWQIRGRGINERTPRRVPRAPTLTRRVRLRAVLGVLRAR
jgi:hypothetical protein